MSLSFKLEAFEGPLDLLLHLIEKNKVNIYDIPIALITDQYMEYIYGAKEKDLDNISEFLVMATTLLNIKSKMLLPKVEILDEEEEDPRTELVERLLEYKMYKYASVELKDRQIDADHLFFKKSSIPQEVADYKEPINVEEILSGVSLSTLNDIFLNVMKRKTEKIDPIRVNFGRIEKEEVTLRQKLTAVQEYGLKHKKFLFKDLLLAQSTKVEIVVTFLSVLELMKLGIIGVVQDELFKDIYIEFLAEEITEIKVDE